MRIRISTGCGFAAGFVRSLSRPGFFDRTGSVLHDGRNTVKLFRVGDRLLVVKRYGHLTAVNRFLYGLFRKSKAERAYEHAIRLRSLGIGTPGEVAFLEIRRFGLLRESCFVSEYSTFLPLRPVTERDPADPEAGRILRALSGFLFSMHEAGVLHKDLNIGNLLYREDGKGGYEFQVIDTNRMRFYRRMALRRRLDNLRRLSCSAWSYLYILDYYAELVDADRDSIQLAGVVKRLFFEMRQRTKRGIKCAIRHCFGRVGRRCRAL